MMEKISSSGKWICHSFLFRVVFMWGTEMIPDLPPQQVWSATVETGNICLGQAAFGDEIH